MNYLLKNLMLQLLLLLTKKFEGMDICTLLKENHVIFDVKCTLDRNIIDARL